MMTKTPATGIHTVGLLARELRLHLANLLLPPEHRVDVGEVVRGAGAAGVQGHLTLAFPMTSRGTSAVRDRLAGLQAALYEAADAIGTLHYCRFIAVDDEAVYLLADFDGPLDDVLEGLADHLGPILDPVLEQVTGPPPTPVASNGKAFVAWARAHCIRPFADYSAYPGATVLQIGSEAAAAGIDLDVASAQQLPLLVIMPMKGRLSVLAVEAAFQVLTGYLKKGGDSVGTVHFASLVKLPHNHVGFFTIYDGPFEKYTQDFADRLGPAFDLLFRFTKNPPPTPTSKNAGPFSAWVRDHDLAPLAFYSGYPGLQVQDVKALLTGSLASPPSPASATA
jgi:hypothetical protein